VIRVKCSSCKKPLRIGDEFAGRRFTCNHCGAPVAVPKRNFLDVSVEESAVFDGAAVMDADEQPGKTRQLIIAGVAIVVVLGAIIALSQAL